MIQFEEVECEGITESINKVENPHKTEEEYILEKRLDLLDMAKSKIDHADSLSDEDKQRLFQVIDDIIETFETQAVG